MFNESDVDAHRATASALARVNEHVLAIRARVGGGVVPAMSTTSSLSASVSLKVERARRASNAGALQMARGTSDSRVSLSSSSAYDRFKGTQVHALFESIIERHGQKFPAVRDELREKLPLIVERTGATRNDELLAIAPTQLDALLSPQLRLLVVAFAKRALAQPQH